MTDCRQLYFFVFCDVILAHSFLISIELLSEDFLQTNIFGQTRQPETMGSFPGPPEQCSVAGDRHPELLASRGI